ncbi:armadillo-type protein [Scheffersomyces amazonensis]|uniref:armadillo-type protein n=1 Tax=Scheffersomyces amazonensis TaxID=1078765 RepID=UPI00315C9B22
MNGVGGGANGHGASRSFSVTSIGTGLATNSSIIHSNPTPGHSMHNPTMTPFHTKSGSGSITSSGLFPQTPMSFVTPTTSAANGTMTSGKPGLWDSASKLNHNLNLPNFNIDASVGSRASNGEEIRTNTNSRSNSTGATSNSNSASPVPLTLGTSSVSSTPIAPVTPASAVTPASVVTPATSTSSTNISAPSKIDKEYLASINKVPLIQLKSEILKLSKDQYGCRFLQKKIDENLIPNLQTRQANFEIIFDQINPYLYELIIDPFGNYLIQKLIGYCSQTNLNLCLEILQFNLFQISINQHGTRALQKIIDNLTLPYQLNLLIKGLKPFIIKLIKDLNGNHVIQKILNKYNPQDCQFIYDSIIDDLYVVATHKHGCCVLQKCLNHVDMNQLNQFSTAILNFNNFTSLINDQFGNYVLQYLISLNIIEINLQIYGNFLKFGIENLCNLKFSSNVIEKFLKNCYNQEAFSMEFSKLKLNLCQQILGQDLNKLINDPYGNYVIQTLIDILIHPQVDYLYNSSLVEDVKKLLPPPVVDSNDYMKLSNLDLQIIIIKYWFSNCKIISSFGKRIQSKINNVVSESGSNSNSANSNSNSTSTTSMASAPSMKNTRSTSNSSLDGSVKYGQQAQSQAPQQYRNFRTLSNDGTLKPSVNRNLSLPSNIYNYETPKHQQAPPQHQQFVHQAPQQQFNTPNGGVAPSNDFMINEFPFGFPPASQQQQQHQQQPYSIHQHKLSLSDNSMNQPQPMTHYTTSKPYGNLNQYPTPPPMNYQYQQQQQQQPPQQQHVFQQQQQQQQQQLAPSAMPNRPSPGQYPSYNNPASSSGSNFYYNARTPSFGSANFNPNGPGNNSSGPIMESTGGNGPGGWM